MILVMMAMTVRVYTSAALKCCTRGRLCLRGSFRWYAFWGCAVWRAFHASDRPIPYACLLKARLPAGQIPLFHCDDDWWHIGVHYICRVV